MAEEIISENGKDMVLTGVTTLVCAGVLFLSGVKLLKYLAGNGLDILYSNKLHSWQSTEILQRAYFCNVCEILVSSGLFCENCEIYIHPQCSKAANQKFPCKAVASNADCMKHHWIRGNLHPDSVCDVCEEDCEAGFSTDLRCLWCRRTVHEHCKPYLAEICDFDAFRTLIVPPMSIQVHLPKNRLRRRLMVKSLVPPSWSEWTPLLVVANPKSGGFEGNHTASLFRAYLNSAQIHTLDKEKPETALEWCRLLKDVQFRVLVAGGDGSVAWVLNTIYSMKLQKPPAVGIIPLGTGNDLSRVLGWGPGVQLNDLDVQRVLEEVKKAEVVNLDRWSVKILSQRSLPLKSALRECWMYNYAGFGVDAQVALGFHKTRESPYYLWNSRIFNKLLYFAFGTGEIIEKTNQNLQESLELYLDGKLVSLPSIEGIVILNIDSYGAGMHLWEMGNEENVDSPPSSICDRKLEILAFYSSLHLGGLQMNVGTPYRVGQAKTVKVVLHRETAVHIDGEPWMQAPAEFVFKSVTQAVMLKLS